MYAVFLAAFLTRLESRPWVVFALDIGSIVTSLEQIVAAPKQTNKLPNAKAHSLGYIFVMPSSLTLASPRRSNLPPSLHDGRVFASVALLLY
jgi:hypothetical protein